MPFDDVSSTRVEGRPRERVHAGKADQVVAELEGRAGSDPNFVVAIVGLHVSSSVDDEDFQRIEEAARALDNVKITRAKALSRDLAHILVLRTRGDSARKMLRTLDDESGLTGEQQAVLGVFREMDAEGELTAQEIYDALKARGEEVTLARVEQVAKACDADGNGKISAQESFAEWIPLDADSSTSVERQPSGT